jgi:colicin import membrane protein
VHFGLIISLGLHTALLGWAVLNIQMLAPLRVAEPEPIAVDFVALSEITKLRQGLRTAKQLQAQPKESPRPDVAKKEAAKPTPVAAAPPPPEPAAAKEEPKPEPAKPEPPKPEPPKAELPSKAEPPPKSEPAKDPGADKLAALPAEVAAVPPAPAIDEQQKLEDMLKEQQRQADEHNRLEEEKRKLEEEKQKLEEEKRKLEEDTRKAEEKKRQEDEERKQAEIKRKQAELKKKREEEKRRKEAEAKKKFDAEKIAALLNKMPDKGAPRPSVPLDEQAKALNKGPVLGAPEGRDQQLSASELAILAQIIKSCVQSKWNVLGGGESAQNTQVKVRLRFNPDGTLAGEPQIMNPQNTPYFLAVRDSAVRAVQACEPYSLPPAKYDFWKDIVLNFDPRDMF